jgi:hypothetical protein
MPVAHPNRSPEMANALDTITKLIQSPPGQFAAGGALAGVVWKFFERVEAVLTDDTKLEIAVWLLGVKVGQKMEPWPETFATILDVVFGRKPVSWRSFVGSALLTLSVGGSLFVLFGSDLDVPGFILLFILLANLGPDYLSLLAVRFCMSSVKKTRRWVRFLFLITPWLTSALCALAAFLLEGLVLNLIPLPPSDVALTG